MEISYESILIGAVVMLLCYALWRVIKYLIKLEAWFLLFILIIFPIAFIVTAIYDLW